MKLKSNKIFLVCVNNLILTEFDGHELKTLKDYEHLIIYAKTDYYFCYELSNGDIIFNFNPNDFCYFNMKTFSIQTIIENKKNELINKFKQLNDKNYFYFFIGNKCYEFNIKNGKIKQIDKNTESKVNSLTLGEYHINYYHNLMIINIEDNKTIYMKDLSNRINDILIIDEKEKIFASLTFLECNYAMYMTFFKIRKHNI